MSQYTHRVTIVVPESLVAESCHLACIMGESAGDINTFHQPEWTDGNGILYAVASAVVKPAFLNAAAGDLPESPSHAKYADRALAQQALDTLNQPGGIQMLVDVGPLEALADMGLSRIPMGV